jgi:hypothetical protein
VGLTLVKGEREEHIHKCYFQKWETACMT